MKHLIEKTFFLIILFCSIHSFSQKKRDTLLIKVNDKFLLKKSRNLNNNIINYPIYGTPNSHSVYFVEEKIYTNLNVKSFSCLNRIFKNSKIYKENGFLRINFVVTKLSEYVIFIVEGNKYSKVFIEEAIE